MSEKYVYKEQFTVIGKLGQGTVKNPWNWIQPIWEDANGNFGEIETLVKRTESGNPLIWGIMSDLDETFARWDDKGGKYLACCEVESDKIPPKEWVKWTVPSQTYLVISCIQEDYPNVFESTIKEFLPKHHLQLVGAVHEQYPEPGNEKLVDIYFPIAKGNYFCQSCGMPMNCEEDRGTNTDQSRSEDYCHYCYANGAFVQDETMEEMIESCIPFTLEGGTYPDEKTAREDMHSYFPKMKRWKQEK